MTSESGDVPDWVMKVNRADHHIRDLNAKITAFLAPGLYELVPMRSPDRQGLTLKVHTDLPAELGLVVGDALHNLRSGLDTRIVAVAEQLFGALTEKQEAALFLPVVDDEVTLIERTRAWPKLFGGDAGQLLHVARSVQGYATVSRYWAERHGADQPEQEREHHVATAERLARVTRLSNIDKHRRLHLPWWAPQSLWSWSHDSETTLQWWIAPGPWVDGQEIAAVIGTGADASTVSLDGRLTVVLPGEPSYGGSASDTLDNIKFFVERALEVIDYEADHL